MFREASGRYLWSFGTRSIMSLPVVAVCGVITLLMVVGINLFQTTDLNFLAWYPVYVMVNLLLVCILRKHLLLNQCAKLSYIALTNVKL